MWAEPSPARGGDVICCISHPEAVPSSHGSPWAALISKIANLGSCEDRNLNFSNLGIEDEKPITAAFQCSGETAGSPGRKPGTFYLGMALSPAHWMEHGEAIFISVCS